MQERDVEIQEELIVNMSSCGACAISNLQPY